MKFSCPHSYLWIDTPPPPHSAEAGRGRPASQFSKSHNLLYTQNFEKLYIGNGN